MINYLLIFGTLIIFWYIKIKLTRKKKIILTRRKQEIYNVMLKKYNKFLIETKSAVAYNIIPIHLLNKRMKYSSKCNTFFEHNTKYNNKYSLMNSCLICGIRRWRYENNFLTNSEKLILCITPCISIFLSDAKKLRYNTKNNIILLYTGNNDIHSPLYKIPKPILKSIIEYLYVKSKIY